MMAFFIFLVLFTFPSLFFSFGISLTPPQRNITLTSFKKLQFPLNLSSTGSLSFDLLGGGPYLGVSDGRILKYETFLKYFTDFAYTSPNRTKAFCDGKNSLFYPTCGSPRGLGFNLFTGRLYSCDPFVGLTEVGPLGGLATNLVPTNNGVPYRLLVAVNVDKNGVIYFTDSSAVYPVQDIYKAISSGDATGRLLRYDPKAKKVTVLLTKLSLPFGVTTNSNASFVLVSDFTKKRIRRYWLKGNSAGTSDIFKAFQGRPNEIKRNQDGDFWVAVNYPLNNFTSGTQGVKISPSGQILATVDLGKAYQQAITIVQEQAGKLYVTGINITYVGQYTIKYI